MQCAGRNLQLRCTNLARWYHQHLWYRCYLPEHQDWGNETMAGIIRDQISTVLSDLSVCMCFIELAIVDLHEWLQRSGRPTANWRWREWNWSLTTWLLFSPYLRLDRNEYIRPLWIWFSPSLLRTAPESPIMVPKQCQVGTSFEHWGRCAVSLYITGAGLCTRLLCISCSAVTTRHRWVLHNWLVDLVVQQNDEMMAASLMVG